MNLDRFKAPDVPLLPRHDREYQPDENPPLEQVDWAGMWRSGVVRRLQLLEEMTVLRRENEALRQKLESLTKSST